jgi:site-specific DNA-cytosine methylase
MLYIETKCRQCLTVTIQLERVVTHHLPPNVKCLQCTRCGLLDITLVDVENARHGGKLAKGYKPNLGNLKVINWATVEPIDILTAGYPCQPFSHAGLRKGTNDERHLWPYIKEAIGRIRPSLVFLENVRGHFGLGFRDVLTDLTDIGYDVRWTLIRASDVGAPHRRERLFIFAYSNGARPTASK